MNILQVAVIGAGTMGRGIAQVATLAGHEVILIEKNESTLIDARDKLEYFINRLAEKGKISSSQAVAAFGRIHFSQELQAARESDLLIEAIIENIEVKRQVFSEIESLISPQTILASNTSSLSITSIAAGLNNPERFLGLHFFNPAPLMKLVEVIPALQTDHTLVDVLKKLMTSWNKVPAVAKDTPGFIVNRVARPFYSEAIRVYEEGIAEPLFIDWAMTQLGAFKMGPFTLMDFIGNDINYTVTETVFSAYHYDRRYAPSFTQRRLVEAGYYGRKSQRGFYTYGENAHVIPEYDDKTLGNQILQRIVVMIINEAADACLFGVASEEDIDNAMKLGVNYPKGPLEWAQEWGYQHCVGLLDALYNRYHEDRYRCSAWLRDQASFSQN